MGWRHAVDCFVDSPERLTQNLLYTVHVTLHNVNLDHVNQRLNHTKLSIKETVYRTLAGLS